jgi:hypothetical protein
MVKRRVEGVVSDSGREEESERTGTAVFLKISLTLRNEEGIDLSFRK